MRGALKKTSLDQQPLTISGDDFRTCLDGSISERRQSNTFQNIFLITG